MSETKIQAEFDGWADAGKGESMADGHGDVTRQALDRVDFVQSMTALDVGCGVGWAVRLMKERGVGHAMGVDLSKGMVARAVPRASCSEAVASFQSLPFRSEVFDIVLSIEALYYALDLERTIGEVARVTSADGRALVVVDLFADNPGSVGWADELTIPVHVWSEDSWRHAFIAAGFPATETVRLRDRRPVEKEDEFSPSRWFPDYDLYRAYREAGSLLIDARK